MPCIVEPTQDELREQHRQSEIPGALLCAVFKAMEAEGVSVGDALDHLDLDEAGVSKAEAVKWWRKHKAKDRRQQTKKGKAL